MSSPACRLVDVSFCSQVAANQPLRPAGKTERWLEATNNAFLLVRRCAIRARHHENRLRPVREFDSRPVRLRRVRFSFPVELISFWLRVGCSSIRASICRGFGKPLDDLCSKSSFMFLRPGQCLPERMKDHQRRAVSRGRFFSSAPSVQGEATSAGVSDLDLTAPRVDGTRCPRGAAWRWPLVRGDSKTGGGREEGDPKYKEEKLRNTANWSSAFMYFSTLFGKGLVKPDCCDTHGMGVLPGAVVDQSLLD